MNGTSVGHKESTHTNKDATNAHTSHVDSLYKDITGITHTHTQRGYSHLSLELWVKLTQSLMGQSNQASMNAASDPLLG